MGASFISNFSVSDETGRQYENLNIWNNEASFEDKKYKSGIKEIDNGVELCWGISEYGRKTYKLKYTIDNFVTQYTNVQGIYFNFLHLDQEVGRVKITISTNSKLSSDNAKIWGFGNDGTIKFKNGKIVMDSRRKLQSWQYMVALVKFENNIFNTSNVSEQAFDDIYESAMIGVDVEGTYDDADKLSFSEIIGIIEYLLLGILVLCFNPFTVLIALIITKGREWIFGSNKKDGAISFGENGTKLPSDKEINYWRDIPCGKDLEMAYWIAYNYNVVPHQVSQSGIIGAILLKWIKENKIKVLKEKKKLFDFKDDDYVIDFRTMTYADTEIENSLFKLMFEAAGNNKVLEAKEFEKWCKRNYIKLQNWFEFFNKTKVIELENKGFITEIQEETTGIFGSKRFIKAKRVNSCLKDEAIKLKGLKKFLLDFSLIPEREYFEVHVLEEYLIYAHLLGIADKVEEQFSKLYPKYNELIKLSDNITTSTIRIIANSGYSGYSKAKAIAESSRSHRGSSSGSGGRSYSSGGRSSRGSSGGGFR